MIKYEQLGEKLDRLYEEYDAAYLYSDPLKYLHQFKKPEDQEVVGLITASLAYGRVEKIFESVETILGIMGPNPFDYITSFQPQNDKRRFDRFVHRFNKGEDVACLIWFLQQIIKEHGSLGNLFRKISDDGQNTIKETLIAFSDYVLSLDSYPFYDSEKLPAKAGVRYFVPSPLKGSPCKRLNLFMRWMVRKKDGLDLGLWDFIQPASLIIPLDTHIVRLARYLGLTYKKSPGWLMAEEVTAHLKLMSPQDPLRYDFSLCRLGILELCPQKRSLEKCGDCLINEFCML